MKIPFKDRATNCNCSLKGAVLLFPQATAGAQFLTINFYCDAECCCPGIDLFWYPTLENLHSYNFRTD